MKLRRQAPNRRRTDREVPPAIPAGHPGYRLVSIRTVRIHTETGPAILPFDPAFAGAA